MARWWRGSKADEAVVASLDPASLGNILLRKGYVTRNQLDAAVDRQLATAPPLGKILVDMGAISPAQLEEALYEQRRLRGGVSKREDVQHHLERQSRDIRQVAEGLNEIAGISNALADKLKAK